MTIKKGSVIVDNLKTSISLEDEFWAGLKHLAYEQNVTMGRLVTEIAHVHPNDNLSSAVRLTLLNELIRRCRELGAWKGP